MMSNDQKLAHQITDSQQRLYGYIYSMVGSSAQSWDILQETNLVIWRKQEEFESIKNFDAWAFTIARFQVMAFFRDRKRDPMSVMTPDLVEQMSIDAEEISAQMAGRLEALKKCKNRLGRKSQELLTYYYEKGLSLEEISGRLKSNRNALKQALHRTRRSLFDCIESALTHTSF